MTSERMTSEPMTCAAVERRLEAYLGEELTPDDENRLARHLTDCPKCAAEVALAERVEVELAALPAYDAPPELIARIKTLARQEQASVVVLASRRPRVFVRRAALAAALLAGLAIGGSVWWPSDQTRQSSAAEIAAAEQEARYALALVARLGRKASAEVRQGILIERVAVPVLRSIGRPFNRDVAAKTGGLES